MFITIKFVMMICLLTDSVDLVLFLLSCLCISLYVHGFLYGFSSSVIHKYWVLFCFALLIYNIIINIQLAQNGSLFPVFLIVSMRECLKIDLTILRSNLVYILIKHTEKLNDS